MVQQGIYEKFVADFVSRASKLQIGDPLDHNTVIGPMISKGHWNKVTSYIELGQKEGAKLVLVVAHLRWSMSSKAVFG